MKNLLLLPFFAFSISLFAQSEEESTLETAQGSLAGVLTIPEDCNTCDVILMISGSGPNDRDGNSNAGVKGQPFKYLSDGLVESGYATLRFDKYFSGSSTYDLPQAEADFNHFIEGFEGWLGVLLPHPQFDNIGILGHSQGAMIATIIARRQPEVDFVISLAGPGMPMDEKMTQQVMAQSAELGENMKKAMDFIKAGEAFEGISPQIAMSLPAPTHKFLRSWMAYDPAEEIAAVEQPVLIINGTEDIQVSAQDAELLKAAQPSAGLVMIEQMNHILKEVEAHTSFGENFATYSNPDLPLHKGLVPAIHNFVESISK
ncbi:MAG: alpha/beta fold hydrolase [Saprospiraceae bacterium]|nr:alpha/beta fold hydrolase [Saprospiraceae bacterium]